MSLKHLGSGSERPAKVEGKLRLYNMQFCPYSQRVRLVLILKNIPHDIVNVNLKDKPDWLYKIHPEAKIPVLDTGEQIITESLDIVEYLEEKYPDPPLHSADLERKEKDKELLHRFTRVAGIYYSTVYNKENKTLDEYMNRMYDEMDFFEEELKSRGTLFFGGDKPGIVDYMIWPWSERSKAPSILYNQEFTFPKERFQKLVAWRTAMKEANAVKECLIEPARHAKIVQLNIEADKNNTSLDYESV